MPRASAAEAAETARRILEHARAVFARDGFAAASVDEIARSAGVTRGAVYHHFESKAGLLLAVVEQEQFAVAARIVERAEAHDDPFAQLQAGCHAFIDAVTAGDTARLLLVEAPAALGWQRWREADAAAGGRELREALEAVDAVPRDRVEAMTQLLGGAMNEAALWLAERPGDEAARRSVHRSLDSILSAIAG
jgi:AcrR family transcriptional regulator